MAKRGKRGRKWQNGYQRRFEDSDFAWMAEQFQKQVALNPDLTLEEFAIRHGVQPDLISRFIDKEELANTIRVWHGTTEDRAKSIMEEGFKATGKSKKKSGLLESRVKPMQSPRGERDSVGSHQSFSVAESTSANTQILRDPSQITTFLDIPISPKILSAAYPA